MFLRPAHLIRLAFRALVVSVASIALTVCSGGTDEGSSPKIAVSTATPAFGAAEGGADPASQVITITNSGSGTLSGLDVGVVTYGAGATGWLQAVALGSTTANPSTTLTLQPVTGALTAGTYTATVPILSTVASNSPKNITVTFNITSGDCPVTAYVLGSTVNSALSPSDCAYGDGSFFDSWSFSATATASVRVNMTSGTFDTFLFLTDPDGNVLAVNDDGTSTTNSTLRVLLGSASYMIQTNSLEPSISGNYSMSTSTIPPEVNGCEEVWVTPGIATTQAVAATDCVDDSGPFYHDEYALRIAAGQSVTVTQHSTAFEPFMLLVRIEGNSTPVVATAGGDGPDATFTYINTQASAYYIIVAATNLASETGAYTLTIPEGSASSAGLRRQLDHPRVGRLFAQNQDGRFAAGPFRGIHQSSPKGIR